MYGFGFPGCVYECMNVSMRVYVGPHAGNFSLADAFWPQDGSAILICCGIASPSHGCIIAHCRTFRRNKSGLNMT